MRLKEIRKNRNVSQQKLADHLGVTRSTIAMWENGNNQPDIETLIRISDYFCITVDYLLEHDTPASPPVSSFSLTPHEQALIEAYRSHPALCSAVDRLLEVAPLSPEDEANARTVSAVVEAVLDIKKEGVPTR